MELSSTITLNDFKKYYWTVKQLRVFCQQHKLASSGSKIDLTDRICQFLLEGDVSPVIKVKSPLPDSCRGITSTTPVINYKNDAKTRDFFITELGSKFRFNHYLRGFAKKTHDGSLCYGDLVRGYKASLSEPPPPIGDQFKFNKFQRDFFKDNPSATRSDCIKAWNFIKLVPSGATYESYLRIKDKNEN